jgi:hypothetical protein
MSEWITDRLPTADDALPNGDVWIMSGGRHVVLWPYGLVELDQPWQPIPRPAPYVKPKRWTVEWNADGAYWVLTDGKWRLCMLMMDWDKKDAAQRICDIYNEAIP